MMIRKSQNLASSKNNPNENWMQVRLARERLQFSRQSIWGKRIFDFWSHKLGIAIEVDGLEHDAQYDQYRDEYNFRRSGIVVLRVKNKCETDADKVIKIIKSEACWADRKFLLGLTVNTKAARRSLSNRDCPPFYLPMYLRGDLAFL